MMWNCMCHMHDFCNDITHVTVAGSRKNGAVYGGELHCVEHGIRPTIKEIKSSLLPGKDKVAHYHRGRCCLWAGITLFTAKIKLFQFIVDVRATNLQQKRGWRGSFGWYESFNIATVYLVLGPLRASFGSLSGPFMPQRLLLTVRRCLPQ